jgi:hypothetical protein
MSKTFNLHKVKIGISLLVHEFAVSEYESDNYIISLEIRI